MVDFYFSIKLFTELAPIVLFLMMFIIMLIITSIKSFKYNRKIKYLQSIGFERYLINVASVGNKAWYGWQRDDKNEYLHISEEDLARIDYKELKKRFSL